MYSDGVYLVDVGRTRRTTTTTHGLGGAIIPLRGARRVCDSGKKCVYERERRFAFSIA